MAFTFSASIKYKKTNSPVWTIAGFAGTVPQQSETLAMQKIRDGHKGCEVILTSLKWK